MTPLLLLASALVATRQIPIYFEPNAGQAEVGIRFLSRGPGYTLSLRPDRTAVWLRNGRGHSWKAVGSEGCGQLEAERPLPGRSSYYLGNDPSQWIESVPQFGAVWCRSVYPGIDVVYRGDARQLEYDFVVAPRADPERIALEFDGVSSMSIDRAGDLVLRTGTAEVRHHKPAVYQELNGVRVPVQGSFVRKGKRRVGFRVASYDRARTLIIDPVLKYSTYLGSFNEDEALGVAVDSQGNMFVAGSTKGRDFPGTRPGNNGGSDVFVTKFSAAGVLLQTVLIGGSADDVARAIAVDPTGAAYITGSTKSGNYPVTTGVFLPVYGGGGTDAFVTKLAASDLSIVYSMFLGGGNDDTGNGIAVDAGGNAYVAGGTTSYFNFPTVPQSYQPTKSNAILSGFVTKLNPTATQLVYSTYILGVQTAEVRGIAVDSGGMAHLAGVTQAGLTGSTATCNQDAFYLKLNALGTQAVFSTCLGGTSTDEANAIAVDSTGAAYLAGFTKSFDYPQVPVKLRCGNFEDAFVTKIDAAGNTVYSACLGGSNNDRATAVAVDARGIVYFTGTTESDNFPVTADAVQSRRAGQTDAFVASADPAGTVLLSSTYLGGSGVDRGAAIAIDARLSAVVAGTTLSSNFPVTSDAFQPRSNGIGGVDTFLTRLQFPLNYPRINAGGIVNGASFQSGPVAVGSQVTLFGVDLATAESAAKDVPLPVDLIGTAVLINGYPVPLFYVGPGQVNIQVPPDLQSGDATAVVTLAGVPSAPQTFSVAPAAPGLYVSGNHALAQNQDWSTNTPQAPAETGSVVVVYLTGIGQTDIPTEAGKPAPPDLARPVLSYSATIGGQPAEVLFLGLTPGLIGTAQANLRVPNLAAGEYPVQITVGGAKSNTPVLSVK